MDEALEEPKSQQAAEKGVRNEDTKTRSCTKAVNASVVVFVVLRAFVS